MRNALVFALLGLALGLAAYWVATPGRDAVRRDAPPAEAARAAPAPQATQRPEAEERVTAATPPAQLFEEDPALVPPRTAPEAAEDPRPPLESPQQRVERLVAAGFSAERAGAIVQTESQQRLSAARAEYAATGTIRALGAAAGKTADTLRTELGDADYERYLAATGQPTRVVVGAVEPGSAAANAGLLPGDEVHTYRGRRVFNVRELNALLLEGTVGQTVPATVVRDGQAMQLYVSGGPLGAATRSAR
jgi:PDZ domain-containing protein